jgi:hypothetical protein
MILHLINRAVTSQLKKSGSSENLDSNSGSTLSDYYFLKKGHGHDLALLMCDCDFVKENWIYTQVLKPNYLLYLLTAVCSCLPMCAGDAGFAESLRGNVKRK